MGRKLPILLTAVAVVVVSGVVHGMWTNRWTKSRNLKMAADRLNAPPPPEGKGLSLKIGDWEGEELSLSPKEIEIAGIEAYRVRRYENKLLGKEVALFLVCGRPGPIAVHTPDVCFQAGGFKLEGKPQEYEVKLDDGRTVVFWSGQFRQEGAATPRYKRAFWIWSGTDGNWKAADWPRVQFARFPALYKLYVHRELINPNEPLDKDPCVEFIRVLMPKVQDSLFAPDTTP